MTVLEKQKLLKKFMKEFFPFNEMVKFGFFKKEMKNDYEAQAKRVCEFFGYATVYEYGAKEIRCHLSTGETDKDFVTVIPSIYE